MKKDRDARVPVLRNAETSRLGRGEDVVASLLAEPASLGTYLAVLHAVLAVLLALPTANAAGFGAGPEGYPRQLERECRLSGEYAPRGGADVGASDATLSAVVAGL